MKAYRIFMISVIVVLAANLVFKSCQAKPRPKRGIVLNPSGQTIKPYVQEYFNNKLKYLKVNSTKYLINIKMFKLTTGTNKKTAGICHVEENSMYRYIVINESWWKNESSEIEKRWVIHHELAHCDLNYDHDDSKRNNIMHPTVYGKYTEELFQQKVKEMFLNHTKVFKKLDGSNF